MRLTLPTEVIIPEVIRLNPQFMECAEFVHFHHDAVGQLRKGTSEPYIVHPLEVASIVATCATEFAKPQEWVEVAVMAALLHDTIEDTKCTYNDIEREFGHVVRDSVFWLTDVTDKSQGNRRVRKELEAVRLYAAPGRVKFVKCADIISNGRSILADKPETAELFLTEKRAVLDKFEYFNRMHKGTDAPGKLDKNMLKYTRTIISNLADKVSRP